MKCELCHKADAEEAITRKLAAGGEEELYVCHACAASERKRLKSRKSRTRKVVGLPPGVSMSVTEIGGDGETPPPIVEAIMNAFSGMVSDLEKAKADQHRRARKAARQTIPVGQVAREYRLGDALHLEGLHLIGELEAVLRATRALELGLDGIAADGIATAGHVFRLSHAGTLDRAHRTLEDLLTEERHARIRLVEEMPRVFGDAICRALAILKNCRLLSPGELFDLLSPMRLAAIEGFLEGIDRAEIEQLMTSLDLSSQEDKLTVEERDRLDAERADAMNARFEDVVLSDRAEERLS